MALDCALQVPPYVHWRRFDTEIVVLNLKEGTYYGLNDVAASAFAELAAGRTPIEVVRDLLGNYEIDESTLTTDIEKLVGDFLHQGILVTRSAP
jgi:coenzyme PQQ synthesis protein D (PqqD)